MEIQRRRRRSWQRLARQRIRRLFLAKRKDLHWASDNPTKTQDGHNLEDGTSHILLP